MCNVVNTKLYFYSIWYARKLRSITVYNGFWISSVLLSCFILNPCVFHFRFWLPGNLWSVKSKSSAVFVTRKVNNIVYSPAIRRFAADYNSLLMCNNYKQDQITLIETLPYSTSSDGVKTFFWVRDIDQDRNEQRRGNPGGGQQGHVPPQLWLRGQCHYATPTLVQVL